MLIRLASAVKRFQVSELKGTRRRTVQDGSVGRPPLETKRAVNIGEMASIPNGPNERRPRGITTEAPSASVMRSSRAADVSLTFFLVERADATVNPRHDYSDLGLVRLPSEVMQKGP